MKTRLRSMGIGGTIAAALATGALLLPATPAQALPASQSTCDHLVSVYDLAVANNDWIYAWEIWERWYVVGCNER